MAKFWQRLNFAFILSTDDYKKNSALNVGSNSWTANPHCAFTWQFEKVEFSGRINYAWTSKNNDPASYLNAHDVQPGQAVHGDLPISYPITENIRAGVNGYFLRQLNADKIDGERQDDSRERVNAIGPGIMYRNKDVALLANYYSEGGAENRPEGDTLTLRVLYIF